MVLGPTDSDTVIITFLPTVLMVHTQTQGMFSFLLHKTKPYVNRRSVIESSNIAITDLNPVEGNDVWFRFLSILLTKCIKLARVCVCAWSVLKLLTLSKKKMVLQSQ